MTDLPPGTTIRPITEDEYPAWARATESAFFTDVSEERLAQWRRVCDLDRSLAAFDGDRIVGGSLLFRMAVTVPGGELAMGGLTGVGIIPTHRRRGLLGALMQRHFEAMREWGEPLSGLYAAEYPIYGRYGYGSAAPEMHWKLSRSDAAFRPGVEIDAGVELVDEATALETFPAIYEAVRATRPGMPSRDHNRWRNRLAPEPPGPGAKSESRYFARLGERGYAIYTGNTGDWAHGLPRGTMTIIEHVATDVTAAASLWRYLFDHDLLETFEVQRRPLDDLLPLLLTNPRGLVGWQYDGMWLRPLDIAAVLGGRTYAVDSGVTIGVVDKRLSENTGSWALEGGPDGAACRRSDAEPDLLLDVGDLGGAYLGHLKFARLLRAGRAEECTPGAATRADLMFTTDPAPWCPEEF